MCTEFILGQLILHLTMEEGQFATGRLLPTATVQLQQICPAACHYADAAKFLASCKHTRVANSMS